jgi:hypothetical protein
MKVTANVVYPIYGIEVEVADNATEDKIRETILDAADNALGTSSIDPVISECFVRGIPLDELSD